MLKKNGAIILLKASLILEFLSIISIIGCLINVKISSIKIYDSRVDKKTTKTDFLKPNKI